MKEVSSVRGLTPKIIDFVQRIYKTGQNINKYHSPVQTKDNCISLYPQVNGLRLG